MYMAETPPTVPERWFKKLRSAMDCYAETRHIEKSLAQVRSLCPAPDKPTEMGEDGGFHKDI